MEGLVRRSHLCIQVRKERRRLVELIRVAAGICPILGKNVCVVQNGRNG